MLALTGWATDAIATGGPLVLVLVMFLENVFPPIPSEVVLPLAGYMVEQGELNPVVTVLAATLGSVLGAVVLYEAGRHGGRPLLLRHGRVLRLDEDRMDRADGWMDRHGSKVVFAARMVPLARSVVSVPAGTTRMGRGHFLIYTATGSFIWNTALDRGRLGPGGHLGAGRGLGGNPQHGGSGRRGGGRPGPVVADPAGAPAGRRRSRIDPGTGRRRLSR